MAMRMRCDECGRTFTTEIVKDAFCSGCGSCRVSRFNMVKHASDDDAPRQLEPCDPRVTRPDGPRRARPI